MLSLPSSFMKLAKWVKAARPDSLLGIDISPSAVKLLELGLVNGNFRVESFGAAPLMPGVIVDNKVKNPEALTTAVEFALNISGTKLKSAVIAVPDVSVITKVIQLDAGLNDEEMEQLINAEVSKYIPNPADDISFDFSRIGPSTKNPATVDVLLVASHKENIEARVDALMAAGLTTEIVDVESYAIERASSFLLKKLAVQSKKPLVGIVDIGSIATTLTVIQHRTAIFSRAELFGAQQLTAEIQQRYQLSEENAKLAQRNGTLPDDYLQVVNAFKETAVIHIRRCMQLFYSSSQHSEIDHIFLAGGGANIPGLAEYVQKELGCSTTVANPFTDMLFLPGVDSVTLMTDAPSLMISCGLALRSFDE